MPKRKLILRRRDIALAVISLLAIAAIGGSMQLAGGTQLPAGGQSTRNITMNDIESALLAAEPGERGGAEGLELAKRDAFWNARYTYPTGKADRKWLEQAAQHDQLNVRPGVPAGQITYNPEGSESPMVLSTSQWTSIGPKPQDSNTCEVCFPFGIVAGRVNDVVVDPITQTIAYIASDGGGVWKTTNCCSAATTWAPVTDSPLISTVAIGDLALDGTNHYVYAGTGDLRFGSFSFGSAGLLKSTDLGATWQIKGADVFRMPLPQPAGQFPQYDSIGKVAIDPLNSNNLIVGTKRGVFFSYNGGDNWTGPCLPDPFPNQRQDITTVLAMTNTNNITDLVVAVGSRGYSTTVQYNLAENGANGIYTTTMPLSGCPAAWNLISRADNGWPVGSGSGIPQYVPGGNQLGRIDMAIAPSNPNYIYAEVQAINPGNGAFQRGGLLGVWRSTNRGVTWQQRVTGLDLEAAQNDCGGNCVGDPLGVCGDVAQNWYDQHIAVDPNDPNVIFFDNVDVWKSTDGGDTIRNITCGYSTIQVPRPVHVDQHAITFLPGSSTKALFGNDGGIYLSESVNLTQPTFVQLNASLSTIEFYSGDISANFATSPAPYAVAGAQDNGSSSWTGDPTVGPHLWQQRIGGDGMFARIEPVLGQRVYMEAQGGALRRSDTGHQGPYPLLSAETNYTLDEPRLSFVFPYEIYKGVPVGTPGGGEDCPPTGCTHMIGGTYRVWENLNGALPESFWYVNSPDLTKGTLADRSFINQLNYAPRTDDIAIAGTNDGNLWIGFGLGRGNQNPATWANVTGGNAVLPNRPILDVALDGSVAMTTTMPIGYAAVGGFDENTPGTPGHVFKVTCTGANCSSFVVENKTGNLPNVPADTIVGNPKYRQQVFVGTDWGVYYTNNIDVASPVWYRFNAGMPNVMIWDFAIDRGFTTLAAFTRSRGAYVWPLPSAPFVGPTPTGTALTPTATTTQGPPNTPYVPPTYTVNPSITASATRTATAAPPTHTPGGPTSTTTPTQGVELVLYDQYNRQGVLGSRSQRYNGAPNDSRNLQLADDFVVPSGQQWVVTSAAVDGFYNGSLLPAGSVNVFFYTTNMTGTLPGAPVISMTVVPEDSAGAYKIRFSPAVNLSSGSYWFSVQANLVDTSGWFWLNRREPLTNNPAAARQPNSAAVNNACRDWTNRGVCVPGSAAEPDQVFLLNGYLIGAGGGTATTTATPGLPTVTSTALAVTSTSTAIPPTQTPGGPTATLIPTLTATTTATIALPTATTTVAPPTTTATVIAPTGTNTVLPSTFTPTATLGVPTLTRTATSVLSATMTATGTPALPTSSTTSTTQPTGTATRTATLVATQTPGGSTATLSPTQTRTPTGTNTVVIPSATSTVILPTMTPGVPSATTVPTSIPTNTLVPTSTRTNTVVIPSATRTTEPTQTPGGPSATTEPSQTPMPPTSTSTITPVATSTVMPSATATACTITFTDVDETNVFYSFIRCLACRGIVSGYNDGTFRPFNDITRGQIAKVVSNSAGFDEDPGPQIYEDVDANNPFYQWINRLSMRGHMGGYPCGTVDAEPCIEPGNRPYFRPFNNATRGQLSKIVANAAGVGGTPTGVFYTDVQEDNPFYVWIMRLTNLGVMSGYECGGPGEPCDNENRPYFRPFNNVTRGQASKIVANTFFPGCETPTRR